MSRIDCVVGAGVAGPSDHTYTAAEWRCVDQRADDAHALCFDQPPLVRGVALLGQPEVHMCLSIDLNGTQGSHPNGSFQSNGSDKDGGGGGGGSGGGGGGGGDGAGGESAGGVQNKDDVGEDPEGAVGTFRRICISFVSS